MRNVGSKVRQKAKIVLAGGGTGGHFFPLLAIAEELREKNAEVFFIVRENSWEKDYCCARGIPCEEITAAQMPGKSGKGWKKIFPAVAKGFFRSYRFLGLTRPQAVLAAGGYASFPVLAASLCRGIPFFLHEQNVIPGKVTRLFARFSRETYLTFGQAKERFAFGIRGKLRETGCPLRSGVIAPDEKEKFSDSREGGKTLIVLGGSQGARRVNELIVSSLPFWARMKPRLRIIHITGEKDFKAVQEGFSRGKFNFSLFPFCDRMSRIYSGADLAVTRGGAVTLAELSYWGVPAVVVPYPYAAENHQYHNARFFADRGAVKIMEESVLTAESLAREVSRLLDDENLLKEMSLNMKNSLKNDAAGFIAGVVYRFSSEKTGNV